MKGERSTSYASLDWYRIRHHVGINAVSYGYQIGTK